MASQDSEFSFILNVKEQFSEFDLSENSNLQSNTILQDCEEAIAKIFEMISSLMDSSDCNTKLVITYINETTVILRMLNDFINKVYERDLVVKIIKRSFPLVTGRIILVVFTHCKHSETLYGTNIQEFEKALKDLFMACRELQMVYLKILSTSMAYDLTITEEFDMLISTLNIYLQIGEVVNNLDAKTVAEQWKAYVTLCEKYSSSLKDSSTLNTTVNSIVKLAIDNVRCVIENDQPEKLMLRYLKVTIFLLKILVKMYEVFKDSSEKDYGQTVYVLSYLMIFSSDYLVKLKKTPDFSQNMEAHLSGVVEHLLSLCLGDEKFLHEFTNFPTVHNAEEDLMLGYIHLLITIMKNITKINEIQSSKAIAAKQETIIIMLFKLLPKCQIWFNSDFKYKCSNSTTIGLYEYLLINTAHLVSTYDGNNYSIVEKCMYEAILNVDFWKALFACDLWIILASISPAELLYNQLIFLCSTYKKLNKNKLFRQAPQKVHFHHLLEGLYKALLDDFKAKFSEQFSMNEDNLSLWAVLKMRNMPYVICTNLITMIQQAEKKLESIYTEDLIYELINIYQVVSACSQLPPEIYHKIKIFKTWNFVQIFFADNKLQIDKEEEDTFWFFDYIDALCAVTNKFILDNAINNANIKKVLLIISTVIDKTSSTALQRILLNFLYKVIKSSKFKLPIFTSEVCSILHEALKRENSLVAAAVCDIVNYCNRDGTTKTVTTNLFNMVQSDVKLKNSLAFMLKYRKLKSDCKLSWKEQLVHISQYEYSHKCLEQVKDEARNDSFEFDFESLLDSDEPANKKTKLDSSCIDSMLCRLENDASLLFDYKKYDFNDEHRIRFAAICDKLKRLL